MKVRLTRKIWNATKIHSLSCRGDLIPLSAPLFFFFVEKQQKELKEENKIKKTADKLYDVMQFSSIMQLFVKKSCERTEDETRNFACFSSLCMSISLVRCKILDWEKSQQPTATFNGSREAAIIELFVIQQDASAEIWNWKIIQFLHRHKRVGRRACIDETWRAFDGNDGR